jgi:hypothetical protein
MENKPTMYALNRKTALFLKRAVCFLRGDIVLAGCGKMERRKGKNFGRKLLTW